MTQYQLRSHIAINQNYPKDLFIQWSYSIALNY